MSDNQIKSRKVSEYYWKNTHFCCFFLTGNNFSSSYIYIIHTLGHLLILQLAFRSHNYVTNEGSQNWKIYGSVNCWNQSFALLSLMKRYLAQTLSQEEARKMHPNDFIKQLDIRLLSVDNFMDIHFLWSAQTWHFRHFLSGKEKVRKSYFSLNIMSFFNLIPCSD